MLGMLEGVRAVKGEGGGEGEGGAGGSNRSCSDSGWPRRRVTLSCWGLTPALRPLAHRSSRPSFEPRSPPTAAPLDRGPPRPMALRSLRRRHPRHHSVSATSS